MKSISAFFLIFILSACSFSSLPAPKKPATPTDVATPDSASTHTGAGINEMTNPAPAPSATETKSGAQNQGGTGAVIPKKSEQKPETASGDADVQAIMKDIDSIFNEIETGK